MTTFALKLLMQDAHRQARIWVNSKKTESYAIAFSVALKAEWAAKAERARIRAAQESRRASKRAPVQSTTPANQPARASRRIVPLEVAKRDGLNHGKSWYCKERDIEAKGAAPEWEGDLICYVYA